MNLKDPKQLADTLRDIVSACAEAERKYASGYLSKGREEAEIRIRILRGFSALGEYFDPDLVGESLEPFNIPVSFPPLPEVAKEELSALADVARVRVRNLMNKGETDSAERIGELVQYIEGLLR